jgi:hypothetical protein
VGSQAKGSDQRCVILCCGAVREVTSLTLLEGDGLGRKIPQVGAQRGVQVRVVPGPRSAPCVGKAGEGRVGCVKCVNRRRKDEEGWYVFRRDLGRYVTQIDRRRGKYDYVWTDIHFCGKDGKMALKFREVGGGDKP